MSKKERTDDVNKKKKKVDKFQLAKTIVACVLTLVMIVPIIISAIYYIVK